MSLTIQTALGPKTGTEAWVRVNGANKRALAIMQGGQLTFHWPISPPASLSAPSAGGTSVDLSFPASGSVAVSGYLVYYRAGADFVDIVNADGFQNVGTNLTPTIVGLSPGQTYYFRVVAQRFYTEPEYHASALSVAVAKATESQDMIITATAPMPTAAFAGTFFIEWVAEFAVTTPQAVGTFQGTFYQPTFTGVLTGTAPHAQAVFDGVVLNPVYAAVIAGTAPMATGSFQGTFYQPVYVGTFAVTAPHAQAAFAGTVLNPQYAAQFAVTAPMPTASLSGTFLNTHVTGVLSAIAPLAAATFAGTLDPGVTASFGVTVPMATASMAGTFAPVLTPDITFAYQNLDVCPTIQVCADLSHTNGSTTKQIGMQWKVGTGGTWSTESTFAANTLNTCMSGVTESTDVYVRVRYIGESTYDEYGPITSNNCLGGGPA